MDVISKVTHAVTHPVQTAESVATQAIGIARTGVRTSAQVVGWAVDQGRSVLPGAPDDTLSTNAPDPDDAPTRKAPAKKTAAKKAPPKKAAAKKAAAKKAAVKTTAAKKTAAKKAPPEESPPAQAARSGPAQAQVIEAEDQTLLPSDPPPAGEAPGSAADETPSAPTPEAPGDPSPEAPSSLIEETPSVPTEEPASSETDPEPLLDPATAKAVRSEAAMMQKASDPDKA